ncbi:hypothetical protein F5H01DRAFT_362880 [Linnemannia elongata]|nr:hypothetical protein F5H01DRAFT_362880 [Linnemannia elongata]
MVSDPSLVEADSSSNQPPPPTNRLHHSIPLSIPTKNQFSLPTPITNIQSDFPRSDFLNIIPPIPTATRMDAKLLTFRGQGMGWQTVAKALTGAVGPEAVRSSSVDGYKDKAVLTATLSLVDKYVEDYRVDFKHLISVSIPMMSELEKEVGDMTLNFSHQPRKHWAWTAEQLIAMKSAVREITGGLMTLSQAIRNMTISDWERVAKKKLKVHRTNIEIRRKTNEILGRSLGPLSKATGTSGYDDGSDSPAKAALSIVKVNRDTIAARSHSGILTGKRFYISKLTELVQKYGKSTLGCKQISSELSHPVSKCKDRWRYMKRVAAASTASKKK